MKLRNLEIPDDTLADFCRRWQITELAVFGSVLRDDFRSDSDVDFLVTYAPNKKWEAWGYLPEQEEMEALLGREVDLVDRQALMESRNPLRKRTIFETAEVIYAAS